MCRVTPTAAATHSLAVVSLLLLLLQIIALLLSRRHNAQCNKQVPLSHLRSNKSPKKLQLPKRRRRTPHIMYEK
jgi:hypothetical protein